MSEPLVCPKCGMQYTRRYGHPCKVAELERQAADRPARDGLAERLRDCYWNRHRHDGEGIAWDGVAAEARRWLLDEVLGPAFEELLVQACPVHRKVYKQLSDCWWCRGLADAIRELLEPK